MVGRGCDRLLSLINQSAPATSHQLLFQQVSLPLSPRLTRNSLISGLISQEMSLDDAHVQTGAAHLFHRIKRAFTGKEQQSTFCSGRRTVCQSLCPIEAKSEVSARLIHSAAPHCLDVPLARPSPVRPVP